MPGRPLSPLLSASIHALWPPYQVGGGSVSAQLTVWCDDSKVTPGSIWFVLVRISKPFSMNEGKQRCIELLATAEKPVGLLSDQVEALRTLHATELLAYCSTESLPSQVMDSGCSETRDMITAPGLLAVCPWNPRATTGTALARCLCLIPS